MAMKNIINGEDGSMSFGPLSPQHPHQHQQQQTHSSAQRKRLVAENLSMATKWSKSTPLNNDSGDGRHSIMTALKSKATYGADAGINVVDSGSNIHLTAATINAQQRWNAINKHLSSQSFIQQQQQQQQQHQLQQNSGDDSEDGEISNSERESNRSKIDTSPRSKPIYHKRSINAFNEAFFERKKSTNVLFEARNNMPGYLNDTKNDQSSNVNGDSLHKIWPQEAKMNFVTMLGLVIAFGISKFLKYLQIYFNWFKVQIEKLRKNIFGSRTFWEMLNIDDNNGQTYRKKLILMPIIGICTLLYGIVSIIHLLIRFLLAQVPDAIVVYIQKIYLDM